MSAQEQTLQALRRAMRRALRAGAEIVCGAYEVADPNGGDLPVGVCALGAENYFGDPDDPLALPEGAAFSEAWDAIEEGFDDVQGSLRGDWYEVGAQLREEFRPVDASDLERELQTGGAS